MRATAAHTDQAPPMANVISTQFSTNTQFDVMFAGRRGGDHVGVQLVQLGPGDFQPTLETVIVI